MKHLMDDIPAFYLAVSQIGDVRKEFAEWKEKEPQGKTRVLAAVVKADVVLPLNPGDEIGLVFEVPEMSKWGDAHGKNVQMNTMIALQQIITDKIERVGEMIKAERNDHEKELLLAGQTGMIVIQHMVNDALRAVFFSTWQEAASAE